MKLKAHFLVKSITSISIQDICKLCYNVMFATVQLHAASNRIELNYDKYHHNGREGVQELQKKLS